MDDEIRSMLAEAILEQGQRSPDSPSSPMIVLLRGLAKKGKFREMSEAFSEYRRVYPQNALFVGGRVAAIVSTVLTEQLDIGSAVVELNNSRPAWADDLKATIGDPAAFVNAIDTLKAELREIAA